MAPRHPLLDVPPGETGRHFEQAAMLILARRNWKASPQDRIQIVELRRGCRVDVVGSEGGKPVRYATYHEQRPEGAVRLADTIRSVLKFPVEVIRLGTRR